MMMEEERGGGRQRERENRLEDGRSGYELKRSEDRG